MFFPCVQAGLPCLSTTWQSIFNALQVANLYHTRDHMELIILMLRSGDPSAVAPGVRHDISQIAHDQTTFELKSNPMYNIFTSSFVYTLRSAHEERLKLGLPKTNSFQLLTIVGISMKLRGLGTTPMHFKVLYFKYNAAIGVTRTISSMDREKTPK